MRSLPVLTILITAALLCAPIAATADFETSIERTAAKGLQVVVQVRIDGTLENPDATPSGSGVIVDPQGLIITNHHVVQKAKRINIRLHGDDADYTATVLGEDARNDLALIRIDTDRELPYARIADSDKLKPGQWVVAIGNPLGLVSTVSAGVVSHVARETPEHIIPFIQFDAIIDKGSSGGPVFNLDAEVVGIVKSGADRGIGLAIPSNIVDDFMRDVLATGEPQNSWIGVGLQPLTEELAEHLGLSAVTGVVINDVVPGSPAEIAGIIPGDILARVGALDVDVGEAEEVGPFIRSIRGLSPNRIYNTVIYRRHEGIYQPFGVELTPITKPGSPPAEIETAYGFVARQITRQNYRSLYLDAPKGVVVSFVRPGSSAETAGLAANDVIAKVEGGKIENLDDLEAALKSVPEGGAVLFEILRADRMWLLLIQP